ncbi:MAG: hypothetical protein CML11_02950 [Puniceicoccaceae bacterium]|nr:hypothetical protein [Puniceicoccaceae bacterium]
MSENTTKTEVVSNANFTAGKLRHSESRYQKKNWLAGFPSLTSKKLISMNVTPRGRMTTMPVMNAFLSERNIVEICFILNVELDTSSFES